MDSRESFKGDKVQESEQVAITLALRVVGSVKDVDIVSAPALPVVYEVT